MASAEGDKLRQIRRTKLAMVFQHFALFPHKTVADNVAYGLKVKGVGRAERRNRALVALEQVGLKAHADTYTDELSGGMQQRVGLARGLATDSDILLMDEPFSALDPLIRRDMQGELLELQRSLKKTIVFITHDLDEALILGDRIAIMKDGEIVQIGTAREIVDEPADDYVSAFTQDIDRARVLTAETAAVDPEAMVLGESTVEEAIRRMEALDRDALYVVKGRKPVGVVAYRDLTASGHAPDARLRDDQIISDFPTVPRATPLRELYAHASSGLPIGIVDEKGNLTKVVETRALFEQLANVPRRRKTSPPTPSRERPRPEPRRGGSQFHSRTRTMFRPSDIVTIPFDDWVDCFVKGFLVPNFRGFFHAVEVPVDGVMFWLNSFFAWIPMIVFALILAADRLALRGTGQCRLRLLRALLHRHDRPVERDHDDARDDRHGGRLLRRHRHPARHPGGRQRQVPEGAAAGPRHHADDPVLRVSGADRHAVRRRLGAGRHRDDHLRAAADHPPDQSRHPAACRQTSSRRPIPSARRAGRS